MLNLPVRDWHGFYPIRAKIRSLRRKLNYRRKKDIQVLIGGKLGECNIKSINGVDIISVKPTNHLVETMAETLSKGRTQANIKWQINHREERVSGPFIKQHG
jgi:dissimilatory sulfite reductase (desulfoviridin) alpha/beta subunit